MGPKMVSGRKNVGEIGPNDSVATVEIINTFKMIQKNWNFDFFEIFRENDVFMLDSQVWFLRFINLKNTVCG